MNARFLTRLARGRAAAPSSVAQSPLPKSEDEQSVPVRSEGWLELLLYAVFAAFCTLWVALQFYGSLRLQTLYALNWQFPEAYEQIVSQGVRGPWSAPLDDVFIHFDFARSTARGYPFQWSVGNGYSSGGTSLLYPFVLAVGYLLGWRDLNLMVWAGVVACTSVFVTLLAARRLFSGLPRITSYLAPLAFLSVGGLDWTLFSGMEVALFLAMWAVAYLCWESTYARVSEPASSWSSIRAAGILLGLCGALVVAVRPEGAVAIAVFAFGLGWRSWSKLPLGKRLALFAAVVLPGIVIVVGQGIANRVLTGDSTAAGALVKLELNDPKLSLDQVWDKWKFHLEYQILRVTHYHFGKVKALGWLIWVLAAIPWFSSKTRRQACLLWATAGLWVLLIATNGQVRWQNERYSMPAVAWFLLAAGLGVGVLVSASLKSTRRWWIRPIPASCAVVLVSIFVSNQIPRFWAQVWFFGRASRNIFEQHVQVATLLRRQMSPIPRRVLLGDAGAIPYVSDLPALDLIGLGGYRGLPFADAGRWSVAAGVELIERMDPALRPDVMALYPGWWKELPLWFSERTIARIPARGNVICGAPTKVVYLANWQPLKDSALPFGIPAGWLVRDELDLADVVSEHAHAFELSRRGVGDAVMKILPHPERSSEDLWDSGRIFTPSTQASFELTGLRPNVPAKILIRVAPSQSATIRLSDARGKLIKLPLGAKDAWQHVVAEIPGSRVTETLRLELTMAANSAVIYHLWVAQLH